MPQNSSPPEESRPIEEATIVGLRTALTRQLQRGSDESRELREALERLASEARCKKIGAEKVLVLFKQVWHAMPEVRLATDRAEKNRVLERLVTICIEEYYREQ